MAKIVPALLVENLDEAKKRIELLPEVEIMSVDIMDGTFVEPTTYFDAVEINSIESEVLFELDLIVDDPLPIIKAWAKHPRTARAIVHAEIDQDIRELLQTIHGLGLEAGLALLPKTKISDVEHLLNETDMVLIRGNEPGYSGRPLDTAMLGKVAELNQEHPDMAVTVDIGVNKKTIFELVRAGATHLSVNSAIYKEEDPVRAYEELRELASE
ncbi:hypothetical protein HOI83_02590 [Candidatus Uhrbacteria bacterium]|jgi:ribulose-phosphate 3-epimerase|nr:hypothetical protein [Candidatus Uhrbacteria bacterium]